MKSAFYVTLLLTFFGLVAPVGVSGITIPDPGLEAAIRDALSKPSGPLTEQDMLSLTTLSAGGRNICSVVGLEAAQNLKILDLDSNALTNFPIVAALTNLTILDLFGNHLTDFTLSNALPKLAILDIGFNSLTNCSLPTGLTNLDTLFLEHNGLTNLNLPSGLSKLTQLDLSSNQLAELTLPPDLTALASLFVDGNPLTTFVLPETLANASLATTVVTLQNQGVPLFIYPLAVQFLRPRPLTGVFQFGITGPPGAYSVSASTNLADWIEVEIVSNKLGSISFVDTTSHLFPQRFYRARSFTPPANMIFVPPNTFTMGSPTNELNRQADEGPQTTVTLTHGFWIGKYEVTQGEYFDVTGTNPSFFPGDLSRPVSSLTWPDATNYCRLLTQRELTAGRIPPDSEYRLPTEAEWECAARAGTTTRFSYGDDPDYTNLTDHAWFVLNSGFPSTLTLHPVGQKLPNPWGLYDMTGNVWEWCQDWLGDLPGGAMMDPTGPPSSPIGWKVVRGGSYDFDVTDCRSARRFGNIPAGNDTDIGFRVVLVMGSQ